MIILHIRSRLKEMEYSELLKAKKRGESSFAWKREKPLKSIRKEGVGLKAGNLLWIKQESMNVILKRW